MANGGALLARGQGVPRARPKISKPGEHGGLVVVAASGVIAAVLAPEPQLAAAAALAGVVAYMARGPVERWVRGFRLREWDRVAMVVYAIAIGAAVGVVAAADTVAGVLTAAGVTALVAVGAAVSAARKHRHVLVELIAMAGCGALAGVFLYAGGGSARTALALAAAMAAYGASSVLFVRVEVRPHPATSRALAWSSVLLLASGAAVAALLASVAMIAAFAPRASHCAIRGIVGPGRKRRMLYVALRETAELSAFVVLVAVLV